MPWTAGISPMAMESVNITIDGKSQCLRATYYKDGIRNMVGNTIDRKTCVAEAVSINRLGGFYGQCTRWGIYDVAGKAPTLTASAGMGGGHVPMYPIRVGTIESGTDSVGQEHRVYSAEGKSKTLCGNGGGAGAKTGLYTVPTDCPALRVAEATAKGYTDIFPGECVDLTMPNSKTRRGRAMKEKANCLTTSCQYYECESRVEIAYKESSSTSTEDMDKKARGRTDLGSGLDIGAGVKPVEKALNLLA